MKKLIIICLLILFPLFFSYGIDLSVGFGPWTFISDDERIADGLYPYAGLNVGWNDYLESELFVVAEAAPDPAGSIYLGGGIGSSVLGNRGLTYFNMYIQADFLYGFDFSAEEIAYNRLVGLRLSPLAIGNGYNGYRDRIFTLGAFYNLDSSSFSFTWNLFVFDIFLKWP